MVANIRKIKKTIACKNMLSLCYVCMKYVLVIINRFFTVKPNKDRETICFAQTCTWKWMSWKWIFRKITICWYGITYHSLSWLASSLKKAWKSSTICWHFYCFFLKGELSWIQIWVTPVLSYICTIDGIIIKAAPWDENFKFCQFWKLNLYKAI